MLIGNCTAFMHNAKLLFCQEIIKSLARRIDVASTVAYTLKGGIYFDGHGVGTVIGWI